MKLSTRWMAAVSLLALSGCAEVNRNAMGIMRGPTIRSQLPPEGRVVNDSDPIEVWKDHRGVLCYVNNGRKTDEPYFLPRDVATSKRGAGPLSYLGAGAAGAAVGALIPGGRPIASVLLAIAGVGTVRVADYYSRQDSEQGLIELQYQERQKWERLNAYGGAYIRRPSYVDNEPVCGVAPIQQRYNRQAAPAPQTPVRSYDDSGLREENRRLQQRIDNLERRQGETDETARKADERSKRIGEHMPGLRK